MEIYGGFYCAVIIKTEEKRLWIAGHKNFASGFNQCTGILETKQL